MKISTIVFAIAAIFTATTGAFADGHSSKAMKSVDTKIGPVLANGAGMTLYIFDKDEKGKSNCYGKCAVNWPPYIAKGGEVKEGEFSTIKRKDDSLQWAYDGNPLYTWIKDKKMGDVTGDGVKTVWHVVKY